MAPQTPWAPVPYLITFERTSRVRRVAVHPDDISSLHFNAMALI